jgi:hypothetical protein
MRLHRKIWRAELAIFQSAQFYGRNLDKYLILAKQFPVQAVYIQAAATERRN